MVKTYSAVRVLVKQMRCYANEAYAASFGVAILDSEARGRGRSLLVYLVAIMCGIAELSEKQTQYIDVVVGLLNTGVNVLAHVCVRGAHGEPCMCMGEPVTELLFAFKVHKSIGIPSPNQCIVMTILVLMPWFRCGVYNI